MAERLGIIVGAALACALLAAVMSRGLTPALALVPLAALPILIVTLGWSVGDGLATAMLATLVTSGLLGMPMGPVAAYTLALPALMLGAVWWAPTSLYRRPVSALAAPTQGPSPGQLGMAAAAIVSVMAMSGVAYLLISLGGIKPAQEYGAEKIGALLALLPEGTILAANPAELHNVIALLVHDLPLSGAELGTAFLLINLYLAARAVALFGRLTRPWVDLPTGFRLPVWMSAIFVVSLAAAIYLPDGLDAAPWVIVGAMGCLYFFLGLATLHALTRGAMIRPFALVGLYFALLIEQDWIPRIIALIGLLESVVSARTRFAASPSTPPKAT